jgi:polar amino acid transport system substrate-binding protein
MKRTSALTLTALLAFVLGRASSGNASTIDYQPAFAAMADSEARALIVRVNDVRRAARPALLHAVRSALNAAVGRRDDTFDRTADSDSADGDGLIGNVNRLMSSHARARVVALDAPVTMVNPASYTTAQAKAGLMVYASNCSSCHGADLNGGSAPAVAGTQFLTAVKGAKWTLTDLRYLVVKVMPLYVPAMLTPKHMRTFLRSC